MSHTLVRSCVAHAWLSIEMGQLRSVAVDHTGKRQVQLHFEHGSISIDAAVLQDIARRTQITPAYDRSCCVVDVDGAR